MIKVYSLIFFSVSVLAALHFYLESLTNDLRVENEYLAKKIKEFEIKYTDLVNYNLKTNKNSNEDEIKDFKEENDNEVQILKSRLGEIGAKINKMKEEMNSFSQHMTDEIVENIKSEIINKQEQVNSNYFAELKNLREQYYKKNKKDFTYYYLYTKDQREQFSQYNRSSIRTFNLTIYEDEVNEIRKNYTELFKRREFETEQEGRINQLKSKIDKASQNWNNFKASSIVKINELKNTIKSKINKQTFSVAFNLFDKIRSIKSKVNSHLKEILGNNFEVSEYYNNIYELLGNKNFNYIPIFNSKLIDTYEQGFEQLEKNLINKSNLLFWVQLADDSIVGGYLGKQMPSWIKGEEIYLNDNSAFIFELKKKLDYSNKANALEIGNVHFSTFLTNENSIYFYWGNIKNKDGLELNYNMDPNTKEPRLNINYSKISPEYEVPKKNFLIFNKFYSSSDVKVFKIYKLDLIE